MNRKYLNRTLRRIDVARSQLDNEFDIPITLLARADVTVESEAIEELLAVASLQETLARLGEWERSGQIPAFWGSESGRVEAGRIAQIVLTPDFHKGAGIPIGTVLDARGFVIPAAVGNDICCGMRLLVTDATRDEISANMPQIESRLRAIFFQGQRDIPMSPRQRESLLRDGLWGLHETCADNANTGIWRGYDPATQSDDLSRTHFQGVLPARDIFGFADFIRASGENDSRDPQIGSVGGGNHFVEIQSIDEICDGGTAHAWGLPKDAVTIMAHSGSVGLGHMVGGHYCGRAYSLYPHGRPHPKHGFYVLPTQGPNKRQAAGYLDAMRNAANFAFGNRLFLGLMTVRALSEAIGREISARLIYDAPHNLIWEPGDERSGNQRYLHRKGATPAPGPDVFGGPFEYTGHPVIIPGSMGASSFVLAGQGDTASLESACHGAGRALTRGRSGHVDDEEYARAVAPLHVVTPIDPESPMIRNRRDILAKYHQRMKEEAPYAYKPITPVVQSVEDAGVARRVVRLWPLVTVKG